MEHSSYDLLELMRRCTVRVTQGSGHGTGFFVAPGFLLTCAHVVEAAHTHASPVEVRWDQRSWRAQIVTFLANPYPDLALLHIEDVQDNPCVYLHRDVNVGHDLYSYGYTDDYPNGDSATFAYEGPTGTEQPLLKLKAGQARPGLSGAPLLNLRTGAVCGIVRTSRDRESDLGGRAVPTAAILSLLSELVTQQQQFHQRDTRWLDCLNTQQRQQFPWRTVAVQNPFYGQSPRLVGRTVELARIEEKLRGGNHCSIVGPSGSGKSLLLRKVWQNIPAWLGYQPQEVLLMPFRGITTLRELQETIVAHYGGQKVSELRSLLRVKSLRLLLLDDLGGMDSGQRGLAMRRWLRGLDDLCRTKLLMVSNEWLDVLFRKDDPTRDSPLAGLDPLPVSLTLSPVRLRADRAATSGQHLLGHYAVCRSLRRPVSAKGIAGPVCSALRCPASGNR